MTGFPHATLPELPAQRRVWLARFWLLRARLRVGDDPHHLYETRRRLGQASTRYRFRPLHHVPDRADRECDRRPLSARTTELARLACRRSQQLRFGDAECGCDARSPRREHLHLAVFKTAQVAVVDTGRSLKLTKREPSIMAKLSNVAHRCLRCGCSSSLQRNACDDAGGCAS
jgi:hypothetical protein